MESTVAELTPISGKKLGSISDPSEKIAQCKQDVLRAIALGEAEHGKPLYYVQIVASFVKHIEEA